MYARAALVALAVVGMTRGASAESKLVLPFPAAADIGDIPAATYDTQGERIGPATMSIRPVEDHKLRILMDVRIEGGARTEIRADFEIIGANEGLKLLHEQSHSHDENGRSLGLLEIDHNAGTARCQLPDSDEVETLTLPEDDRVANIPMNILFIPLIRGEVDAIEFQVFLCRGGARFMDFVALRSQEARDRIEDREVIEVRYGPDLGNFMSWAASQILPKLTFWFDAADGGQYIGHRFPLFSKGPEVKVVREGVSAKLLRRY